MLSKKQLLTIGCEKCEDIPHQLWNKSMKNIFKKCDQKENYDQNQTYKEFIEMKLTGANQDGTGRYPFKSVKQIQITFVLKQKTNQKQKISQKFTKAITQIVSSFFQISTKFIPSYLYLTKKRTIIDQIQQMQYEPSHMKQKPYAFDVFSLFQVGFQSKEQSKNRLFLIQADLHQEQMDVDGRACGDGIAFITFYPAKSKKVEQKLLSFTIQTLIHENLHTFGFDHCSAWNCLMNAYTNFQFWLCPCCLRKLETQIQKPVLQWYKQLIQKLKQFEMKQEFQKGVSILNAIQNQSNLQNIKKTQTKK